MTYAPAPSDADPMTGPSDAEQQGLDAEERAAMDQIRFNEKVADRAHHLKVEHHARRRFELELAGPAPLLDAALLGDVLMRGPTPEPRVEGLVPWEAGTLIVAQKKCGKTTAELNLARSLITGRDFLGRFGVRPVDGNVALLNYEVSDHQIATWANDQGIPRDRLLLVNLRGRRNPLRDDSGREDLIKILRSHDVEALIVDPYGRAYTGKSQNDPGEVTAWLTELDTLARADGAGCRDVVLSAHAGWNGERTRGSTALDDWADSIITITRDRDDARQRFLRAEGRDVDVDEDQLTFDTITRTLRLAGTGSRKTSAKVRQLQALMPAVMDLLTEAPWRSGNQLDGALNALIASGDLDATHSKGDGARAANLLEKGYRVISKDGPRNSRLFAPASTSPTSPQFPEGSHATSPTSLSIGGSREGSADHLHLPSDDMTDGAG